MPHIHKLYDYTTSTFIVHKDTVLLVHHPRYDKWIPMGGHIELDEDPEQALYREIKEETGLDVEILSTIPNVPGAQTKFIPAPNYMDVHEANPPHKHICFVYFARSASNKHVLSGEHLAIEWLSKNDLDEPKYNLSEDVKFYCREALKLAAN